MSRITDERKTHLRRMACGIVPTLPEDQDEALFVLHELQVRIAYLFGGASAACSLLTAEEASALVESAKGKADNVRVFSPRIAMWLGALALITQMWMAQDPLDLTADGNQTFIARHDASS